jgi:DNA-binding MarR family transcriptional regulator
MEETEMKNIATKSDKEKTKRELILEITAKIEKALAESIRTHEEVERRLKQDRLRKGSV